jgi:hypothetical protein
MAMTAEQLARFLHESALEWDGLQTKRRMRDSWDDLPKWSIDRYLYVAKRVLEKLAEKTVEKDAS